ncbi:MAG: hypothetical protein KC420_22795, partial [Myxococcales bacterium]|nr:hypothetical protein [Myxococcales bacterium]
DGTPLRFLVVDSAAPKGGPVGVIRGADVDAYIEPALVDAAADGKWVLVVSHHPAGDLGDGGGPGGEAIADALTSAEWEALLGAHDRVIAHLVGHSHEHRARWVEPLGGHAYWEVTTAAIADFPHQMRLVEIGDGDNGHLSLRLTAVDLAIDGDALGAAGKARAVADHTSGWSMDGSGTTDDRNVVLWAPLP